MEIALLQAATSVKNERIFSYVKNFQDRMPSIPIEELYKRILLKIQNFDDKEFDYQLAETLFI